ncbi:hypothetical protein ACJQWK_05078 [Exserohilum turcicum]|uniref:JmjC domain-containing protein n=1 Tax=Exserohilum turcicum (strain 28A) TaxID=671987 RepID=R0I8Q3_EXST2|nr:uncharacterized protein SETTUDRAFT_97595 [Exserohilum turcica Et28A]EOA81900.1 hypothetical protein SETTUDRAFT_97595 [Exserohilum turcica Et28A]
MFRLSRRLLLTKLSARRYSSGKQRFTTIEALQYLDHTTNLSIPAFDANEPAVFKSAFRDYPAVKKWFISGIDPSGYPQELNAAYLERYGDSFVSLEVTRRSPGSAQNATFDRIEAPFSLLLAHMGAEVEQDVQLYLAQHSLEDLPAQMKEDLPTPVHFLAELKSRGDIYASSLWMGKPPTRTPLHRDPNSNLFVQLAGKKTVRMMRPEVGRGVFERVRLRVRGTGGGANMRGEEMMQGSEMEGLETAVWGEHGGGVDGVEGCEITVASGDALYVPLGWWHAVRGVGEGANASVNWWFR